MATNKHKKLSKEDKKKLGVRIVCIALAFLLIASSLMAAFGVFAL